ncbi:hypothetical protein [Burkholderia pseudomallei]|uniref:hypothetical protein n=1 Tax=Burkholderia pseudomallei TaxID=28450 RepID=UPI0027DED1E6|nr:hypothetical protein [Burkholderia pseudomallei]
MKVNALAIALAVSMVGFLTCCSGNAIGGKRPKPIGVSIWCTDDTPTEYRVKYPRAPDAIPNVPVAECVDMTQSIPNILPSAVDVEYVAIVRAWMVTVVLNEGDAPRVKSLIDRNLGKAMIIDINKKVFTVAFLATPMKGNKIYIRVPSEQAGRDLEKHFEL